MRKLVYMSKELELALKIYVILANRFRKEIWENFKQIKILWSKQINLVIIIILNSILDKYRDFTKLFADRLLEDTLSAY